MAVDEADGLGCDQVKRAEGVIRTRGGEPWCGSESEGVMKVREVLKKQIVNPLVTTFKFK